MSVLFWASLLNVQGRLNRDAHPNEWTADYSVLFVKSGAMISPTGVGKPDGVTRE